MSAHRAGHHVGTKLLFENDRVRVWEMILRPGEESTRHEHAQDYLFVYATKSKLMVLAEGKDPETSEEPTGFVQYTEVGQGIVHSVRNIGTDDHHEVLIEFKGPSRSAVAQEPETNE